MTQTLIDTLNSEYGLRMYSFSDYTPAFIVENMQMIIDASVRGLKSLAYTKDTDYAEIFAPTGQAINISCFARFDRASGTYVEDSRQGANWAKTKSLRMQYRNVGAVMVATNDAMVEWALKQDWIDVVIPYHIVKTGTTIANEYDWNNYTADSADKAGNKAATIYPTEHNNDFATFKKLIAERGLTPRFEKWFNMVSEGKLTEAQYMKLVNEVRLPASELGKVSPNFNLEAAKRSFGIDENGEVISGGFVDKGGYMGGWYKTGIDADAEADAVASDIEAGKSSLDVDYGMNAAAKAKVAEHYKVSKQVRDGNAPTSLDNRGDSGYNGEKDGEKNARQTGEDSGVLEGKSVPRAADGSRNGLWSQGNDPEEVFRRLGKLQSRKGLSGGARAGSSGVFGTRRLHKSGLLRSAESVLRNVRGLIVSETDTAGRGVPEIIKDAFANTVFKDKNGHLLSLYHWTDARFKHFRIGDIGFHFGTLKAAYDRYRGVNDQRGSNGSYYKEAYVNIKNPVFIDYDPMRWVVFSAAHKLEQYGVIADIEAGKSSLEVEYGMSAAAKEKVAEHYKVSKQVRDGNAPTSLDNRGDSGYNEDKRGDLNAEISVQDARRGEQGVRETVGRTQEQDANGSRLSEGDRSRNGTLGENSLSQRIQQKTSREPIDFSDEDIIIPSENSEEYNIQQALANDYGISAFVIKQSAWAREHDAYTSNGIVYVREGIDFKSSRSVSSHEANHVMRTLKYAPYLEFLERTPARIDLSLRSTWGLLSIMETHCKEDVLYDGDGSHLRVYDELNSAMSEIALTKDVANNSLAGAYQIFYDFDAYISELHAIHEQFKRDNTAKRTSFQKRTATLSDREVLEMASEQLSGEKLNEGEKAALDIFNKRLGELKSLQDERAKLGKIASRMPPAPTSVGAGRSRNRTVTVT